MKTFKQYITEGTPNTKLGDLYTSWQQSLEANPELKIPPQEELGVSTADKIILNLLRLHNHPKTPNLVRKGIKPIIDRGLKYFADPRNAKSNVSVPSAFDYNINVPVEIKRDPVAALVDFHHEGTRGAFDPETRIATINPFFSFRHQIPAKDPYDFINTTGHEVAHGVQYHRMTTDPAANVGLKVQGDKLLGSDDKKVAYPKYVTSSFETRPRIEGAIAGAALHKRETGKLIPFNPDPNDPYKSFSHPVMTDMEAQTESPYGEPIKFKIRSSRKKAILQAAKKAYGRVAAKEQETSGRRINPQEPKDIYRDFK